MNSNSIKEKIIAILHQIQADSGFEHPPLNGTTKPVEALESFDSIVWPVATTMLATEIGTTIPDELNIFCHDKTKLPKSIDEIADFLCDLSKTQVEPEADVA